MVMYDMCHRIMDAPALTTKGYTRSGVSVQVPWVLGTIYIFFDLKVSSSVDVGWWYKGENFSVNVSCL